MPVFFSKTFISLVFTCALCTLNLIAQAGESSDALSVTFEKNVQFLDPEGLEVLISPGTYSVQYQPEHLTLINKDGASFILEATEGTQSTDLPFPIVLSTSGDEAGLKNSHLLMVIDPEGHFFQAVGTYSQIAPRGIDEPSDADLEYIDPALITFENPVYFITPDGSPVVIEPGTYTAEAASPWIRLIPDHHRQNALLIEAQQGTHDTGIEDLLALSLPGTTAKELDLHHVMLLLPGGESLEATGSYSGIQTRSWLKRTFNNAKKKVRRTYSRVKKTPAFKKINQAANQAGKTANQGAKVVGGGLKTGWTQTKWAAGQAGKGIVKGANEAWKGMKWAANQGGVLACKTFFKGQEAAAKLQEKLFHEIQKGVIALRKNSKVVNDIMVAAERFQQIQKNLIDQTIQSALRFNQPTMLNQVKDIVKFENICETGIAGTKRKIQGLLASNNLIQSRGIKPVFSIGIQGAGTFKMGGLEGGAGIASNLQATAGYGFVGGTVQLPSAGGSLLAQVGGWNPSVVKSPKDVGGGYLALGYEIPIKELMERWEGYGMGYWVDAKGAPANFVVNIDILFSWPDGKWHPNPIPAGVIVSPGISGGITKGGDTFLSKHLGRITFQGGYGWIFGK